MTEESETAAQAMEMLKRVSTGMVEDALNMSGLQGGIAGVRPARGSEDAKIVAPAATVLFGPPRPGTPKLTNFRAIHESAPGSVLVIDGKGVDGHFTGDNQGEYAKARGLVAVVVYGGARDIEGFRRIGMPLYCTGSATRNKPNTLQAAACNVPVEVGGVLVKPGDIIVADEDGVVAIPLEALPTVMENLRTIFEVEGGMERAIQDGAPIDEIETIIGKKKPRK